MGTKVESAEATTTEVTEPAGQKTKAKSQGWEIFNHIVIYFTIGCMFGTYYEEIMHMIRSLCATGTLNWVSRRGLLYGPFSPVYGVGAVVVYLLFGRKERSTLSCLIGGALVGGTIEYLLSWLQEALFGTISWDYSNKILNFHGRTTAVFMIIWGIIVTIFVRFVFPQIEKLYHKINQKKMQTVCLILAGFLALDIGLSLAATMRQAERRAGDAADTPIEIWLDTVYNDERMKQTYDNAVYVK